MPNVHGIEFNANQSRTREGLDSRSIEDCAVYALQHEAERSSREWLPPRQFPGRGKPMATS